MPPRGEGLVVEDDLRHRARLSAPRGRAERNRARRAVDCPAHGV
jgi:hypothetical protein